MRTFDPRLLAVVAVVALAPLGCKTAERAEDEVPDTGAAPTAAPSATATTTATSVAVTPTVPTPILVAPPKTDAGAPVDAGAAPVDAGKSDAAAPAGDAGAVTGSAKLKACVDKCQAALASCLTQGLPKDGGVPAPFNPATCQPAFTTCQAACTP